MKQVFVALVCSIPMFAAAPVAAVVADKVTDQFVPAPYESQTIDGFLGDRMRLNLRARLLRVDEQGLIGGFQHRPGVHPWIGEHVGKFLHAAANTYEYTHDEKLKTLMDRLAKELIESQLPDGYLGTYTDDQRWTSWDVWVHKYDLIGLLAYYRATGYQPALNASRKVGDLLVTTFGDKPGQRDIIKSGTHVGMAATSVLEPICMLYRYTGDKRYFDFAYYIVRSWDQPNGPHIMSILDTHNVFKTANAKAYEMLSNIVGLTDLYRLTGDERFLRVAQYAWDDVAKHRLYVSGTASSHEHFTDDNSFPGSDADDVGEGCVTVTWIQLGWQLLRLTGEPMYADELERTVFNQLLAAQDPQNGNICYFTPLIGHKHATPGINCCVSSEPRGISMIPQLTWGAFGDGIAVLLYTPGNVTINGNKLVEQTDFPQSGKITFYVHPEAKKGSEFPIYLRVPYWTSKFTATVNGEEMTGTPGQFLKIERKWKQADHFEVNMDMTVHVLPGGATYPNAVAFQRGPQVLALDAAANPSVEFLQAAAPRSETVKVSGPEKFSIDGIVLDAKGKSKQEALTLIPFTEAQNYRIWINKSDALPSGPVNVAAFGRESSSRAGGRPGSICDERKETFRSTDDGKTPAQDWFAVELNHPEEITRIVYRPGRSSDKGGWFAETPEVQIRRTVAGPWETVGKLDAYHGSSSLKESDSFEARMKDPTVVYAIRVIGKPANYVTCSELGAYAE